LTTSVGIPPYEAVGYHHQSVTVKHINENSPTVAYTVTVTVCSVRGDGDVVERRARACSWHAKNATTETGRAIPADRAVDDANTHATAAEPDSSPVSVDAVVANRAVHHHGAGIDAHCSYPTATIRRHATLHNAGSSVHS